MHGDDTLERFEHSHEGPRGSIEPLDQYVLIEPSDDETETRGGLIIPASADSSCLSGVVVAVGEDVHGVAPGDKVLYPRAAGFELNPSGEPMRLIDRRELIARITD
jgi:co-chaperonin GroES (HSP10)